MTLQFPLLVDVLQHVSDKIGSRNEKVLFRFFPLLIPIPDLIFWFIQI